jgi:hypothetical protein
MANVGHSLFLFPFSFFTDPELVSFRKLSDLIRSHHTFTDRERVI